ncbi:MAG: hypothetical protein RXR03_08515 [Thermocladium sp.]|jgi:Mn-dependent DtxR family transcriptional regulator|nr:MAG: hypothetical protein AT710_06800 [Thermocladium sp. ECH_B]
MEHVVQHVLTVLQFNSAVSKEHSIRVRDLARLINMGEDELRRIINDLSSNGYVELIDDAVFLTRKGMMRVMSKFS